MGKYDRLSSWFDKQSIECIELTYANIEMIIGDKLPSSAYVYKEWWYEHKTHMHARAWSDSGYKPELIILCEKVRFIKK